MENLLHGWDPISLILFVLPLALFGAAWALRMACAICSVRVPDFMPAAAVVIVVIAANLALRIMLNYNDMTLGIGSQLLLVLLTSAAIISLSVRTSIASALAITITQVFICGVMAFGLSEVGQAVL